MFKFTFKFRNREGTRDEFLAPETRPVINDHGRRFVVIEKEDKPAEKVSYKLIMKKRRDEGHLLF